MYNKKVLIDSLKKLGSAKAPTQKKDMIIDPMGQWAHPGENTRIPSNNITMDNVPYPVYADPNVGPSRMMYPEQEYNFPGADYVDEYPQMKSGGNKLNHVVVKQSKIPGANKGLFSNQSFRKGQLIGLAHSNGQPVGKIGNMHNHSDQPNMYSVKHGDERYVYAKRDIQPGEELTTNYRLQPELEQPEDFMRKGGSTPKLPNKKNSRAYSRSLDATNRLFAEHPWFKKSKSRKNKIYDPNARYYQPGGELPQNVGITYLPEDDRSYYDPLSDTINLNPNASDAELNHELVHAWQNRTGRLRTNPNLPQQRPPIVASDEQAASYYTRKGDDVDYYLNNLSTLHPDLTGGHIWTEDLNRFIPDQMKYDKVIDPLMYLDPTTMEGEAEIFSQLYGPPPGISFRKKGGALSKFLDGGPQCPEGYTYNPETKRCEGQRTDCPEGYDWDEQEGRCKSKAYREKSELYIKGNKVVPTEEQEKYPWWPDDLTIKNLEPRYNLIQPEKRLSIFKPGLSDTKYEWSPLEVEIYPDLNYQVVVDPNKPKGYNADKSIYYVPDENNFEFEKFKQYKKLKEVEKENLANLAKYPNLTTKTESGYNWEDAYLNPEYTPFSNRDKPVTFDEYKNIKKEEYEGCTDCTYGHGETISYDDDDRITEQNLGHIYNKFYDIPDYDTRFEREHDYIELSNDSVIPRLDLASSDVEAPTYAEGDPDMMIPHVRLTPGKTKSKKHSGRLMDGKGQRYKHTTYKQGKDLEFGKHEVNRLIPALVQKFTGYDPKYYQGYDKEVGDETEYVPGEIERAEQEGRKINFKGAATLRDLKKQKEYDRQWLNYQNQKDEVRQQNEDYLKEYDITPEEYEQYYGPFRKGGVLPKAQFGFTGMGKYPALTATMPQMYTDKRGTHLFGNEPIRFDSGGEKEAMNAMMKARLAYANMFGNPAAQRMINIPDQPYEFNNGDIGTHYMASIDNYAVPQIQSVNGVLQIGDYGPESNEAMRFDSDEDANYFAENYKDVSPGFNDEQIEEYSQEPKGYVENINYNSLPINYADALKNFVYPEVVDSSEETGYDAALGIIKQNPNDPIANVNNPWWYEHELLHHLQNQAGGMSTYGTVGLRPNPYVASDEAIGSYYDRRGSEFNNELNRILKENPDISEEEAYARAEEDLYNNPITTEGEARNYEGYIEAGNPSIFPKKQQGGFMDVELDDNEIDEYRKGGYIVEDISVPSLNKMKKGGLPCPPFCSPLIELSRGLSSIAKNVPKTNFLGRGIANTATIADEALGQAFLAKQNQAAISAGNKWLHNWIQHPTTQMKMQADMLDVINNKNLNPHALKYETPRYGDIVLNPEEQYIESLKIAQNYMPDTQPYSFENFFSNLKEDELNPMIGNVGVTYRHQSDPINRELYRRGYFKPNSTQIDTEYKPFKHYGSFVSRIPRFSPYEKELTVIHEGTHDWITDKLLKETGQKDLILSNIDPEIKKLWEKWLADRKTNDLTNDEKNLAYLANPTEVHARIMELRRDNNLTPSDYVDEDMAKFFLRQVANGQIGMDKDFGKVFKNDPKILSKLMNDLYGIAIPLGVGVGGASLLKNPYKEESPIGRYKMGGEFELGDEVDEATMNKLKKLGFTFEKI